MNLCVHLATGDARVIAAGPLFKQRGCTPYRVVLATLGYTRYAVYDEDFQVIPNAGDKGITTLSGGNYFDDLRSAMLCFARRVGAHADLSQAMED